jgi:hypothetical protein
VASYSISCEFDHINPMITLTIFTLSDAHCTMLDLKDWVRCKHSCTIVESPEGGGGGTVVIYLNICARIYFIFKKCQKMFSS